MIEARELTKKYNSRIAINNISFIVKKGEILGLLGPNGAGKSTTMKILSGFMPATSGQAIVNNFDMQKEAIQGKASLGYLPENPPVYTSMDVTSYLSFSAALHGVPSHKIKVAVNEAMEKCAITDVRDRLIGNLSKGYKQRVGLAQAIAHNPPVLILDEPTVGLDPKQIIDIRNLIKSFEGNHTVILSTHILPEVQATCSKVVVIDHGQVVAQDTLDGIVARMQSNQRLTVLTQKDPKSFLPQLQQINGVSSIYESPARVGNEFELKIECKKDYDLRADVAEFFVHNKLGLLSLAYEKISLEDAFVKLVTKDEITKEINL